MSQQYVSEELTHFVGRRVLLEVKGKKERGEKQYGILLKILKSGKLIPPRPSIGIKAPTGMKMRRNLIVNMAKPFSTGEMYQHQIVCFCDIPVSDLGIHMGKYGEFGLSFQKSFLLQKGANPVFYLAEESTFYTKPYDFDEMINGISSFFSKLMFSSTDREDVGDFDRFMASIFSFMKPFDKATEYDNEGNYYMEREWRVLDEVDFKLEDVFRIILPKSYIGRLKSDLDNYVGDITSAESIGSSV